MMQLIDDLNLPGDLELRHKVLKKEKTEFRVKKGKVNTEKKTFVAMVYIRNP